MPIKRGCESLFGYKLIIKIIDYLLVDYSLIAFGGVLLAKANTASMCPPALQGSVS